MASSFPAARVIRLVIAVSLAALAGWGMALLDMPAPWILGPLLTTAGLSLSGVRIAPPHAFRQISFLAIGTSVGAAVSPDLLDLIVTWPITISVMALSVPLMLTGGMVYLVALRRWDRTTAFFASSPGALSTSLAMAEVYGAEVGRVVISQSLRQLLLIALMPWVFRGLGHEAVVPPGGGLVVDDAGLLVALIGLSVAGGLLLERLNMPGGLMVGAMTMSGLLHGTGFVHGGMPVEIQTGAFVVFGVVVGSRLGGIRPRDLLRNFRASLMALVVTTGISAAFAGLAAFLSGEGFIKVWLAYMPGALEVMTTMAFLLGLDPVFVSTHHILRFIGLTFMVPVFAFWLFRAPPEARAALTAAGDD